MKKILLSGSLALLLAPALAFALNDVSITTDASFTVNSIAINLNGTSATIDSVVVDTTTMSVTVSPGSTISITAPARNVMTLSGGDGVTSQAYCDDSNSKFTLSDATTPTTVTITPSTTLCSSVVTSSGGGGGSNGPIASGGGGGGGSYVAPTQPGTSPIVQTSAPGTSTTLAALQAQVQALLAQIAILSGGASSNFIRNLESGSTGADVKALQVWLNVKGYVVASSGPGSPGNETMKFGAFTRIALAKFQAAVGISPAAGYFGPKTRAYIAAHP